MKIVVHFIRRAALWIVFLPAAAGAPPASDPPATWSVWPEDGGAISLRQGRRVERISPGEETSLGTLRAAVCPDGTVALSAFSEIGLAVAGTPATMKAGGYLVLHRSGCHSRGVSWLDGLPVWRARPTKGRWRSPYQIAAGDLLLVWTARSTLGLFEVQWDGTLDIDGIRLPVAGYDLNDAQLQLSARLRDPVSAVVVAYGDRSWILLGSAVRRSGRKPLPGADADLAESVALAGGLRRPEKKAIIKRGAEFVDADLDGPTGRSWRLLPGDIVVIGPIAGSGPTSPTR